MTEENYGEQTLRSLVNNKDLIWIPLNYWS